MLGIIISKYQNNSIIHFACVVLKIPFEFFPKSYFGPVTIRLGPFLWKIWDTLATNQIFVFDQEMALGAGLGNGISHRGLCFLYSYSSVATDLPGRCEERRHLASVTRLGKLCSIWATFGLKYFHKNYIYSLI